MTTNLTQYNEGNKNMIELVICNNDGMAESSLSSLKKKKHNRGTNDNTTTLQFVGYLHTPKTTQPTTVR